MRAILAAIIAAQALALPAGAATADPPSCAVPQDLLFTDSTLAKVAATLKKDRKLTIAVLGSGSSTLAGPDGVLFAYPVRLEAALGQKLSGISLKVVTKAKSAQTAADMRRSIQTTFIEDKPDLVIWQTGTVDAMRRIAPDEFRNTVDAGVAALQRRGADVVLMNMQYSPRTESMIAVGPYLDAMRATSQQREVPLFDRFAIMRYWADHGAFDFYAPGRDTGLARRVHDCIGRALATFIIEAGHLQSYETRNGQ